MRVRRDAARSLVLRHFPRLLRSALTADGALGPEARTLAGDARTLDPVLGTCVDTLMADNAGSRFATEGDAAGSLAGVVAALDAHAVDADRPAAREIADALLLQLAPGDNRAAASRVVHAVWRDVDRLGEVGAALEALALRAAGADGDEEDDDWSLMGLEGSGSDVVQEPPVDDATRAAAVKAWREACGAAYDELKGQARALAMGLTALAAGLGSRTYGSESLGDMALRVGRSLTEPVERQALAADRRRLARDEAKKAEAARRREEREREKATEVRGGVEVPEGHVMVCLKASDHGRSAELVKPHRGVVGRPMPLVPTPDLGAVRVALLAEYPQAEETVDRVLAGISRPWAHVGHVLVVGPPGVGKSRFCRRLGELLNLGVYRVDGTNDSGGSFGGTERRWHSSEPSRPFLAISRFGHANPAVLVDEIDKATTRTDYGRLWDSMLQMMDAETSRRFQDPCLQTETDLSWVSVLATANATQMLPGPLLDRFRLTVDLPKPAPEHLEALLPAILADLAREKGLHPAFHAPLDGIELTILRGRWGGGSVRRLRRMVDGVLRVRERAAGSVLH